MQKLALLASLTLSLLASPTLANPAHAESYTATPSAINTPSSTPVAPAAPTTLSTTPAPRSPASQVRYSVVGIGGFATPHGAIGVDVGMEPVRWAAVQAGVGIGFTGTQYAAMGRLQTPWPYLRGYIGLGASVGDFKDVEIWHGHDEVEEKPHVLTAWRNAEIGAELVLGPAVVRAFVGSSRALNGYYGDEKLELPYAGAGWGVRF